MKKLYIYFTLGYPQEEVLNTFLDGIDTSLYDGVELGFPSSDPHYDGPAIRKTHSVALSHESDSFRGTLELLGRKNVGKYSLTYYSDVSSRFDDFLSYLSENGFRGIILPDILVDYFSDYRNIVKAAQDHGISVIPFFNASTPDRVIEDVCSITESWVYFGIQPSTGISVPFDVAGASERMRGILGKRELIYGFGIRTEHDIREVLENGGDGIAVGSMFIPFLDSGNFEGFKEAIESIRGVLNDYA